MVHHRIWNIVPCGLEQDLDVQCWVFIGRTPAPPGLPVSSFLSVVSHLYASPSPLYPGVQHQLGSPPASSGWVWSVKSLVVEAGVGRSDIVLLTSPPPSPERSPPWDSCLCPSVKGPCPLKAAESSPQLFKACPLWGVLVTCGIGAPTIPTDWNRHLNRLPGGPQPSCLLLCFLSAPFSLHTSVDRPSATKPSSIYPIESLWVFSSPGPPSLSPPPF